MPRRATSCTGYVCRPLTMDELPRLCQSLEALGAGSLFDSVGLRLSALYGALSAGAGSSPSAAAAYALKNARSRGRAREEDNPDSGLPELAKRLRDAANAALDISKEGKGCPRVAPVELYASHLLLALPKTLRRAALADVHFVEVAQRLLRQSGRPPSEVEQASADLEQVAQLCRQAMRRQQRAAGAFKLYLARLFDRELPHDCRTLLVDDQRTVLLNLVDLVRFWLPELQDPDRYCRLTLLPALGSRCVKTPNHSTPRWLHLPDDAGNVTYYVNGAAVQHCLSVLLGQLPGPLAEAARRGFAALAALLAGDQRLHALLDDARDVTDDLVREFLLGEQGAAEERAAAAAHGFVAQVCDDGEQSSALVQSRPAGAATAEEQRLAVPHSAVQQVPSRKRRATELGGPPSGSLLWETVRQATGLKGEQHLLRAAIVRDVCRSLCIRELDAAGVAPARRVLLEAFLAELSPNRSVKSARFAEELHDLVQAGIAQAAALAEGPDMALGHAGRPGGATEPEDAPSGSRNRRSGRGYNPSTAEHSEAKDRANKLFVAALLRHKCLQGPIFFLDHWAGHEGAEGAPGAAEQLPPCRTAAALLAEGAGRLVSANLDEGVVRRLRKHGVQAEVGHWQEALRRSSEQFSGFWVDGCSGCATELCAQLELCSARAAPRCVLGWTLLERDFSREPMFQRVLRVVHCLLQRGWRPAQELLDKSSTYYRSSGGQWVCTQFWALGL